MHSILEQKMLKNLQKKLNELSILKAKIEVKNTKNNQKKGYVYASFQNKPIKTLDEIPLDSVLILEDLTTKLKVITKEKITRT